MINTISRLIAASLMLFAVAACAGQPEIVHHSFSFGDYSGNENQGVEILNYRYGNDKTAPTRPADWQLASGHIPQRMYMGTFAPPGDFLYVKWRIISTNEIYEDTVDLKSRLPSDMNRKEIHFTIQGKLLNIYLISSEMHEPGKPYSRTCAQLYPEHLSNCGNYKYQT